MKVCTWCVDTFSREQLYLIAEPLIGLDFLKYFERNAVKAGLWTSKRGSAVQREVRIIIAVYWHLIHVVSNLFNAIMQMRQWENKEIHLYLIIVVDMEKFPHQDAKTYFIVSPPITSSVFLSISWTLDV